MKTGQAIRADLTLIANSWLIPELRDSLNTHDSSIIELGELAKLKGRVSNTSLELADLIGLVLRRRHRKPDAPHFSLWSSVTIDSTSQWEYAALDAYATWCLWSTLSELPSVGQCIKDEPVVGQLVSLYAAKTVVAHGKIVQQPTKQLDPNGDSQCKPINITRTRVLILVEEVFLPEFIVKLHGKTLKDLMELLNPCYIVVPISNIRTRSSTLPETPPSPPHVGPSFHSLQFIMKSLPDEANDDSGSESSDSETEDNIPVTVEEISMDTPEVS